MLKDVTLGRYYSTDSVIHRLDPRTKIRFTIIYIILFLLDRNLPFYAMMTGLFVVTLVMSRVPIGYMLKGSTSIFVLVMLCSSINIFTTMGSTVVSVAGVTVTREGLIKFAFVCWRMILIILMSSVLMYTTKPTGIADGLEKCFCLSGNVAMGITIALRFISVLFEELDRIMKAQEARGAMLSEGGPVKRLVRMRVIIVPLFQNAIDRAGSLGEALDAKCYKGGSGRTKLEPLSYSGYDTTAHIFMIIFIAAAIWLIWNF